MDKFTIPVLKAKLSDMGIELEKGKEVDPGIKMIEDGPINIFEDEDVELSENSE